MSKYEGCREMENANLLELVDVEILQKIQDGFSDYTGMAALITDADGVPVTKGSGFTDFCRKLAEIASGEQEVRSL